VTGPQTVDEIGDWQIFRLPRGISSRGEFFGGARDALPLDPPVLSHNSWDALDDSLWGGLDAVANDRILILWPEADTMRRTSPADYAIASEILAGLPGSLCNSRLNDGTPTQLLVLRVTAASEADRIEGAGQ
jgi:hypothetical protein